MTHRLTVAQIMGRHGAPVQPAPRPGTRRRRLYDLLMDNRGRVVEFDAWTIGYRKRALGSDLEVLRNDYELDIRCLTKRGIKGKGKIGCRWLLAGEWDGKVYIDFVAGAK